MCGNDGFTENAVECVAYTVLKKSLMACSALMLFECLYQHKGSIYVDGYQTYSVKLMQNFGAP